MSSAFVWGAVSGGAVLLGAIISLLIPIKKNIIGYIMAFGVGVLIGAATFELLTESLHKSELINTIIGFIAGASTFTILEFLLSHHGAKHRKRSNAHELIAEDMKAMEVKGDQDKKQGGNNSGVAIFVGTVMDAIPESIMLGASLIGGKGVSMLLLIAIFISNIPEGLSSTAGMKKSMSKKMILVMFITVTVIAGISSLAGFVFLDHADPMVTSIISSFAAGGIITMIGATMMPEAYEEGGAIVGIITALGVLTSVILDHL